MHVANRFFFSQRNVAEKDDKLTEVEFISVSRLNTVERSYM